MHHKITLGRFNMSIGGQNASGHHSIPHLQGQLPDRYYHQRPVTSDWDVQPQFPAPYGGPIHQQQAYSYGAPHAHAADATPSPCFDIWSARAQLSRKFGKQRASWIRKWGLFSSTGAAALPRPRSPRNCPASNCAVSSCQLCAATAFNVCGRYWTAL